MATRTEQKLEYLQDTKTAIRRAIVEKGQNVADSDTFRSYADKIKAIGAGGGSSADVRYVTFASEDGSTVYGVKPVAVGDDCADPIARGIFSTPTKESDVQYNYTFAGWATEANGGMNSAALKAVTEDRTVYANFAAIVRYYTITYYDGDTVLKTVSLAYGSTPEAYSPEKSGYSFVGWNPEVATVTGNASYYSQWKVQETLADYTWEQLDAMPLAELKTKFKLGDMKDYYALVGFEQDTLASGTGKARMSFIRMSLVGSAVHAAGYENYVNLSDHYVRMQNDPSKYVPSYESISAVAKPVKKKYVSNRSTLELAEDTATFWIPAASELGYIPDGTTVINEGERYQAFKEKAFGDTIEEITNLNGSTLYNLKLGKRVLRSANATEWLYLNSGKLTKLSSGTVSSVYRLNGFCM